jgi:hypothetical protein
MTFLVRWLRSVLGAAVVGLSLAAIGCGGGKTPTPPPPVNLSINLSATNIAVPQDGVAVQIPIAITGPDGFLTVTVSGLPTGVLAQFATTGAGPSGVLTFTAGASVPAGNYAASVTVSLAGQAKSQSFSLVCAVVARVENATDNTLGVNGQLKQFMSTSFQISEWTGNFFGTGATAAARENTLNVLRPQHIRLQALGQAIPMQANNGLASDWNFTLLDRIVQPVLASTDNSPEFQIATAPAWMCDSNGHLDVAGHLGDFATYAANLVRYYNKGGFDAGGTHFKSPGNHPIIWWGILNEPDYNGISANDYVKIYNVVVPAMLAVDVTIKLSALEFSGSDVGTGWPTDPEQYLPPFFAPARAGGVNTQVDIVSNHLYGACNQEESDAGLFGRVPQFVAIEKYFYQELQQRSDLAKVPVWTTENNVNADYADANGKSACNPGRTFVSDQRGTSAFFAAWRPYVFSQLGKAGNQALYHWQYSGDRQFGEVGGGGDTYLSYWVDKSLANFFPATPASPFADILTLSSTDSSSVETLATRSSNGTITVMVVDLAVHAPADNNGKGDPRTIIVDTSSLGGYFSASLLAIDATTSATNGPVGKGIPPDGRIPVTLNGYGVAFLTLTP